jgi:hypothetical protein
MISLVAAGLGDSYLGYAGDDRDIDFNDSCFGDSGDDVDIGSRSTDGAIADGAGIVSCTRVGATRALLSDEPLKSNILKTPAI